jgi:ABC-type phosphate/phosphonate transport system substrate-binding protein
MSMIPIPSRDLAALDDRSQRRPDPSALTLTFALTIGNNPVGQAQGYAPFLAALERRMEKALGRQVFLNLQLYKANSWASLWDVRKDADVQRVSQLSYVRFRQAGLNVQPLVREPFSDDGVIYVRAGVGCTNLSQAAGLRVVFAHTNSVVSFLGKVCLARAGLCITNFKSFTNLNIPARSLAPSAQGSSSIQVDEDIEVFTHKEVIQRVVADEYDVGVATGRRFEIQRQRRGQLIELARFPVTVDVFVAKAGTKAEVVSALQESLISLRDKTMLGRAKRTMVDGLERAKDSDFDEFRQMMANEWVFFETGQRPAANNVRVSRPK